MSDPARILVAVAWPYANGPLHLGHIAGSLLPPDVFARYHRLRGNDVLMVSGSDMHGTPITVAAEKAGRDPKDLAWENHELHQKALKALGIHFDLFTSTATENHARTVQDVFVRLHRNGFIEKRTMTAPYDPEAKRFLPDRYVEGECPHCSFEDARGDQCDNCGRTLDPQELVNPRSKFTGVTPEFRETDHYFLLLDKLQPRVEAWVQEAADRGNWRPTVRNFTENWLKEGLKARAITRDLTYGIPIPEEVGTHPDKRIYVWFEAVNGYLSAAKEWAEKQGDPDAWEKWWKLQEGAEQYYFLGKDNTPFHTIIWPAELLGYNDGLPEGEKLNLPTDVPANEFLQFAGAKFSKSRGNAFYVLDLLDAFDVDQVRYYLSVNMPESRDTNWTWEDFVAKVNDELVANVGNYVNRVLSFCAKNYEGTPASPGTLEDAVTLVRELRGDDAADAFRRDHEAFREAVAAHLEEAAKAIQSRRFKDGLRQALNVSRVGNQRLNDLAPWKWVKEGDEGHRIAGIALREHLGAMKALSLTLQPYLPDLSDGIWTQLGEPGPKPRALAESSHVGEDAWPPGILPIEPGQSFGDVQPLVQKLDLDAVLEEFQPATEEPQEKKKMETKPTITFDDFTKLDLRVGHVKSVEDHPNADKLYVLKIDLGEEERQILAGLREHVKPEELEGKRVVVIVNLEPRKIRGLESQGMLLAAENGDLVAPLTPAKDVPSGSQIR